MFNGLAEKLFGIVSSTKNENGDDEAVVATASQDLRREEGDEDEWVLLNDDDNSDRGSILDELELVVTPSTDMSSSPSPLTAAEASGWNMMPPPCFAAALKLRGKNKYKSTTKHRNPNLNKSILQHQRYPSTKKEKSSPPPQVQKLHHQQTTSTLDISIFENMLIEHPSISIYQKNGRCKPHGGNTGCKPEVLRPVPSNNHITSLGPKTPVNRPDQKLLLPNTITNVITKQQGKPKNNNNVDEDKDENSDPLVTPNGPVPVERVASKSNLTYVITGLDVCMKPSYYQAQAPGKRLEIVHHHHQASNHSSSACAGGRPSNNRRLKRQNFTVYDSSLFGKGKQRKNRIKNFSGRSNDRRRQ